MRKEPKSHDPVDTVLGRRGESVKDRLRAKNFSPDFFKEVEPRAPPLRYRPVCPTKAFIFSIPCV